MYRVLFVCMGNICRSPAAEGVFAHLVNEAGLAHRISCDSAGTIAHHTGEPADERMRRAARRRGYELRSIARQVNRADLDTFDLVATMDRENLRDVLALRTEGNRALVRPLPAWIPDDAVTEIPDPYYGGIDGFDRVLDFLEDACRNLLDWITSHDPGRP